MIAIERETNPETKEMNRKEYAVLCMDVSEPVYSCSDSLQDKKVTTMVSDYIYWVIATSCPLQNSRDGSSEYEAFHFFELECSQAAHAKNKQQKKVIQ